MLMILHYADNEHRRGDNRRRPDPTLPHASLAALPRIYVRRNGAERRVPRPPRLLDVRRRAAGKADRLVVAGHARPALHPRGDDLRGKCTDLHALLHR